MSTKSTIAVVALTLTGIAVFVVTQIRSTPPDGTTESPERKQRISHGVANDPQHRKSEPGETGDQSVSTLAEEQLLVSLDGAIVSVRKALNKEVAAHEWVSSRSTEELAQLFSVWKDGKFPRLAIHHELETVLFRQFGVTLGASVLSQLTENDFSDRYDRRALRSFCDGCAYTDRKSLISIAKTLSHKKELANEAGWGVFNSLETKSFEEAMGYISRIQDLVEPAQLGARINSLWLRQNDNPEFGATFDRMMASELPLETKEQAARMSLDHLMRTDPAQALKFAETSIPYDERGIILNRLVLAGRSISYPEISKFLIERLDDGDSGAISTLQLLGSRWGRQEPNSIGDLLPTIENQKAYDSLTAGFVRAIWNVDRDSAEAWLSTIKDEKWKGIASRNPVR